MLTQLRETSRSGTIYPNIKGAAPRTRQRNEDSHISLGLYQGFHPVVARLGPKVVVFSDIMDRAIPRERIVHTHETVGFRAQ